MNILKDKFKKFYRKGRTDKEKLERKKKQWQGIWLFSETIWDLGDITSSQTNDLPGVCQKCRSKQNKLHDEIFSLFAYFVFWVSVFGFV